MKGKTGEGKKQRGRASIVFEDPPVITAAASTVGKKEGDGRASFRAGPRGL